MNYPNGLHKKSNNVVNYGNRGMVLEDDLNVTNEYYRENDIAVIYKKPTPIKLVKVDYKKGLIKEAGKSKMPGRPNLYRTTSEFLDYFGLSSLNELPELEEEQVEDNKSELFTSTYKEDKNELEL